MLFLLTSVCVSSQNLSIDIDLSKSVFPMYLGAEKPTLVVITLEQMDTANVKLLQWQQYRHIIAQQKQIISLYEESRESSDYTIQYLDSSLAFSEASNKQLILSNEKLTETVSKQEQLLSDTVKKFRRKIWKVAVPVFIGGAATGVVTVVVLQAR